jgi:internalin A
LRPVGALQTLKATHNKTIWHEYISEGIDLQLFCQMPGFWHPTIDGGLYRLEEPAKWLETTASYLGKITAVLEHAVPISGSTIAVDAIKSFKAEIGFMRLLVTKLFGVRRPRRLAQARFGADVAEASEADGAAIRALRRLLDRVDRDQDWGGLKKVLTPEGHYLWLCEEHAAKYRI